MKVKALVLADHYWQYQMWMKQNSLSKKEYKFVDDIPDAEGYDRNTQVILVGNCLMSAALDMVLDRYSNIVRRHI